MRTVACFLLGLPLVVAASASSVDDALAVSAAQSSWMVSALCAGTVWGWLLAHAAASWTGRRSLTNVASVAAATWLLALQWSVQAGGESVLPFLSGVAAGFGARWLAGYVLARR